MPESDLYCSQCKNSLPYCIATGYHITPTDLTMCPECKFPASRSELLKLVEDGVVCPMCVETLATSDIKVLTPSMLRTGNEEVEELKNEIDEDGDGEIDFDEFLKIMNSTKLRFKRELFIFQQM